MESTKLKIRQMQADIQEALLNEIEHAKSFLLIQDEDIELINQKLELLVSVE